MIARKQSNLSAVLSMEIIGSLAAASLNWFLGQFDLAIFWTFVLILNGDLFHLDLF